MNKKNLLLHSCCAPCSTAVIDELKEIYNITILYYNPNIEPTHEYKKRKQEQIRYLNEIENIKFLDCDYDNDIFTSLTKDLKQESEGGNRCLVCFNLRLEKCALLAKDNFDCFATTLTISPHKDSNKINEIGLKLANKYQIKFLSKDFKKNDGYQRSLNLSNKYNIYRQNYCGCLSSKKQF